MAALSNVKILRIAQRWPHSSRSHDLGVVYSWGADEGADGIGTQGADRWAASTRRRRSRSRFGASVTICAESPPSTTKRPLPGGKVDTRRGVQQDNTARANTARDMEVMDLQVGEEILADRAALLEVFHPFRHPLWLNLSTGKILVKQPA